MFYTFFVELEEAIKYVKSKFEKEDYTETNHYKEQCVSREIELEEVRNILKKNKIKGFEEQNKYKYKATMEYTPDKDLILILNIDKEQLKLITVFPQYSSKRMRK